MSRSRSAASSVCILVAALSLCACSDVDSCPGISGTYSVSLSNGTVPECDAATGACSVTQDGCGLVWDCSPLDYFEASSLSPDGTTDFVTSAGGFPVSCETSFTSTGFNWTCTGTDAPEVVCRGTGTPTTPVAGPCTDGVCDLDGIRLGGLAECFTADDTNLTHACILDCNGGSSPLEGPPPDFDLSLVPDSSCHALYLHFAPGTALTGLDGVGFHEACNLDNDCFPEDSGTSVTATTYTSLGGDALIVLDGPLPTGVQAVIELDGGPWGPGMGYTSRFYVGTVP